MDAIDIALLTAFNNLAPKIRDSRIQAARRFARTKRPTLNDPLRESCLVLRASDLRFNQVAQNVTPDYAPYQQLPHHFQLAGADIAYLNEPIFIPPPGLTQTDTAHLFGRSPRSLTRWIKKGVFNDYTVPAHTVPAQTVPAHSPAKFGRPIHILSTSQPLNPNTEFAQPPHPFLGSTWQYLHQRIPHNFGQTFQRIPIIRPRKNIPQFTGFKFICPGLPTSHPNYKPCNKTATKLYSPTTTWTLFHALDIKLNIPLPNNNLWTPGQSEPLLNHRAFACKFCWRLQYLSHSNPERSWNKFITRITAGLLFGHEVPIPKTHYPQPKPNFTQKQQTRGPRNPSKPHPVTI